LSKLRPDEDKHGEQAGADTFSAESHRTISEHIAQAHMEHGVKERVFHVEDFPAISI
jgi:hypothetical protein